MTRDDMVVLNLLETAQDCGVRDPKVLNRAYTELTSEEPRRRARVRSIIERLDTFVEHGYVEEAGDERARLRQL